MGRCRRMLYTAAGLDKYVTAKPIQMVSSSYHDRQLSPIASNHVLVWT